jgi:hypothetical protein
MPTTADRRDQFGDCAFKPVRICAALAASTAVNVYSTSGFDPFAFPTLLLAKIAQSPQRPRSGEAPLGLRTRCVRCGRLASANQARMPKWIRSTLSSTPRWRLWPVPRKARRRPPGLAATDPGAARHDALGAWQVDTSPLASEEPERETGWR